MAEGGGGAGGSKGGATAAAVGGSGTSRFISPSNSGSSADLMALRAASCAASGSAMTESSGGLGGIVGEKTQSLQCEKVLFCTSCARAHTFTHTLTNWLILAYKLSYAPNRSYCD